MRSNTQLPSSHAQALTVACNNGYFSEVHRLLKQHSHDDNAAYPKQIYSLLLTGLINSGQPKTLTEEESASMLTFFFCIVGLMAIGTLCFGLVLGVQHTDQVAHEQLSKAREYLRNVTTTGDDQEKRLSNGYRGAQSQAGAANFGTFFFSVVFCCAAAMGLGLMRHLAQNTIPALCKRTNIMLGDPADNRTYSLLILANKASWLPGIAALLAKQGIAPTETEAEAIITFFDKREINITEPNLPEAFRQARADAPHQPSQSSWLLSSPLNYFPVTQKGQEPGQTSGLSLANNAPDEQPCTPL